MSVRTIAAVTVARSDYGIYLPVLRRIADDPSLRLRLIVSGAHLSPEFGMTVDAIAADGFAIGARVEMLLSSDSPQAVAKSIGLGVIGFSQAFAQERPDVLLVLGDRFEMFAAAVAALPFAMPVAHIHGGELTHGAIDDALRHAMTKLSHLHFVSTEDYARRVRQLGEEAWRVTVSGAPALDHVGRVPLLSRDELSARLGFPFDAGTLLVTFHPVTLEQHQAEAQIEALLSALHDAGRPVLFTQPNADTGGRRISERIDAFVREHGSARRVDSMGVQGYFSAMAAAAAMVGNSSSGLIEAPSFGLPVVNIGSRQAGRVRAANVIDVEPDAASIAAGIARAVSAGFRDGLRGLPNPYGSGGAAEAIVARLKTVSLDERLIAKRFQDHAGEARA